MNAVGIPFELDPLNLQSCTTFVVTDQSVMNKHVNDCSSQIMDSKYELKSKNNTVVYI